MRFARQYGRFNEGKGEFKSKWGSTVYFRTGTHPDSAEGIQNVRRVWLDEGGKVSLYFFENLMGRAARVEAPIDITTTPYALNWLAALAKAHKAGKRPDVSLVHCKSIESPYFSKAEYERQKGLLDPRRFAMKYDGEFGQIVGLVYDLIDTCLVKSQPLPEGTRYYAGIDWGYVDPFCLVVRAVTPNGQHFRVAEYYKSYLTISDIVNVVKSYHGIYKFLMVYCDPSQPSAIQSLCQAGIPALGALNDIRAGIDCHYELMKSGRYFVFEDQNPLGLDEFHSYHYPEEKELAYDESRKPRDIIPVDNHSHGMDAERYVSYSLMQYQGIKVAPKAPHDSTKAPLDLTKRLAWLKRGGNGGSAYD